MDHQEIEFQQARIREKQATVKAALNTLRADNEKSRLKIERADEEAEEIMHRFALLTPEEKERARQRLNRLYPGEFVRRERKLSDAEERELIEDSREWQLVDGSREELWVSYQ